jgi:hypothetical protein
MPEPELYDYNVLLRLPPEEPHTLGGRGRLIELGHFHARKPDDAIQAAVEAAVGNGGLPDPRGGVCVAVVESKWHERRVAVAQVPSVTVVAVDDGPALEPPGQDEAIAPGDKGLVVTPPPDELGEGGVR